MIGTLFAQEFRITWKRLLVSIGISMLVAVVSFAAGLLPIPFIGVLGFGLGIFAISIIIPLVMGLLAESYWRTMYGREGYFTMTLPVRGRTLFTAKVLYGIAATLVSLLVSLVGVVIAICAMAIAGDQPIADTFGGLWESIDAVGPALVWFVVVCAILQLAATVVAGAAIMSIGSEAKFNHLGFGAPVLGAVMYYVGMQIAGLAAMLFIPFGLKTSGPDGGTFVAQGMWPDLARVIAGDVTVDSDPSVVGLGIVFVSLAVTVWLAWWGARSVERRTSLR